MAHIFLTLTIKREFSIFCLENYKVFFKSSLYMALTKIKTKNCLSLAKLSCICVSCHAVLVTKLTRDSFLRYSKGHTGKLLRSASRLFFKTSLALIISWQNYVRITVLMHTCSEVNLWNLPITSPCGLLKFILTGAIVCTLPYLQPILCLTSLLPL